MTQNSLNILFSRHGTQLATYGTAHFVFPNKKTPQTMPVRKYRPIFSSEINCGKVGSCNINLPKSSPLVHGTLPSPYIKEPLFGGSKNQHFQQKIKALCQLQAGLATLPTASGVWRPPGHAEYWGCFLKENLRANSPRGLYNISYI